MAGKTWWTAELDAELTKLFPNHSSKEVAQLMKLKKDQVCYRAGVLGLKKTSLCRSKSKGLLAFTDEQAAFIRQNYEGMSNRRLAESLGFKMQTMRDKLYEMGLYRMRLEYWTDEQIEFLRNNYKSIGDLELSELFQDKWPKNKKWSKKHIEKKRNYLNLYRSQEDLENVMQRNVDQGRMSQNYKGKTNWLTTGPAKQFEIRMYKSCAGVISPRVKIGKCWKWWARWAWEKEFGVIPKGMVVVLKDSDPYHTEVSNLELVTRSESTLRYAAKTSINLSDKYIVAMLTKGKPDLRPIVTENTSLINIKRQQLILQRTIKNHGTEQSKFRNHSRK